MSQIAAGGLLVLALTMAGCGTAESDSVAPTSTSTADPGTAEETEAPPTSGDGNPESTEDDSLAVPSYSSVQGQTNTSDTIISVYIPFLADDRRTPSGEFPGIVEVDLEITDANGAVLFEESFSRTKADLVGWTRTFSGEAFEGLTFEFPVSDFERSMTGGTGVISAILQFDEASGSVYFELDDEMTGLPAASEEEQLAAATEIYVESAVALSGDELVSRNYRGPSFSVTPLSAGCFSFFGRYGTQKSGVRVDLTVTGMTAEIETFYDEFVLVLPTGTIVEDGYDGLIGKELLPGRPQDGFVFFEDVACEPGEYEVVGQGNDGIYLQETFVIE
jgi:hypothetical protein